MRFATVRFDSGLGNGWKWGKWGELRGAVSFYYRQWVAEGKQRQKIHYGIPLACAATLLVARSGSPGAKGGHQSVEGGQGSGVGLKKGCGRTKSTRAPLSPPPLFVCVANWKREIKWKWYSFEIEFHRNAKSLPKGAGMEWLYESQGICQSA